jgi:type VI secretion system protein VasG
MISVDLRALVGKLNDHSRRALEAAAGLCVSKTHYEVEVEHWLLKLLEQADGDVGALLRHHEVNASRVTQELMRALDRLKTGNSRGPALSPRIPKIIQDAWMLASVQYELPKVRSGLLLLALLGDEDASRLLYEESRELRNLTADALRKDLLTVVARTAESEGMEPAVAAGGAAAREPGAPALGGGKTPALDAYTIDLTARARGGHLDPILGRDPEIRQMIDVLMRRRKNNPILTGEAGVGKTAVVEGLALRVAGGDVPPSLQNVAIRTLDLGLLQAGAGVKGEFENRLKSVIQEVKASPKPIILFIDEAHTLIGAGGSAGGSDAANLLKPALARGELRTIAATTWSEYKQYFEKDAALERRFQVIKVEEPHDDTATVMMRGLVAALEKHHGVRVLDEAVEAAVKLSSRYISGRQLPDKSVDVLDTAAARVAIGHAATPPALEDCQRRIDSLASQLEILGREEATAGGHAERIAALEAERAAEHERLDGLKKRWDDEKRLVTEARGLRGKLEGQLDETERTRIRGELDRVQGELAALQGEDPLMQVVVDRQAVGAVISGWTGIPVGKMQRNEIDTVLNLQGMLGERVVGQEHALEAIAQRIRTARAGLDDPARPIGVFLLVGPSGVGKTETAIALADILYGGERNMTVINMSEFKEEHTVALLKGAPPGYVGYGKGGVLTEAVRQRPYSVVLLDEVEKAHRGVLELFYQVFDKGQLDDSEGRTIDFKNTVILMGSNLGTDIMMKLCADPETRPDPTALAREIRPALLTFFAPALLGRIIVVPYYPIADDVMRKIVGLKLGKVAARLRQNHGMALAYGDEVVAQIAARCTEVDSGARNVDHIITGTLLPEISRELLGRMATGDGAKTLRVTVEPDGRFGYTFA